MNSSFSEPVLQVACAAFDKCSSITNLFVLPLFLGKAAYSNATGGSSSEYTKLLRGVVLYFILIHTFEPILRILLEIPEAFLPNFDLNPLSESRPDKTGEVKSMSLVPSVLMWSLESAVACLYYVAMFLNFAFAVLLASLAPIIFLLCTILGIGFGVRTFFSLLVIVSSWPIVWAAANELHQLVLPMTDGELARIVFEMAITILKIIGPLAIAYFGIASSPGQALATAVTTSLSTGNVALGAAHGFTKQTSKNPFNSEPRPLTKEGSPYNGHKQGPGTGNVRRERGGANVSQADRSRTASRVRHSSAGPPSNVATSELSSSVSTTWPNERGSNDGMTSSHSSAPGTSHGGQDQRPGGMKTSVESTSPRAMGATHVSHALNRSVDQSGGGSSMASRPMSESKTPIQASVRPLPPDRKEK